MRSVIWGLRKRRTKVNRKNKDDRRQPFSVGGISILMVFVMLCLTTFGVLTLVTARAEMRLTEKNAQSVTSYYASSSRLQEILAQIDGILQNGAAQGKTMGEMAKEISGIGGVSLAEQGTVKEVDVSVSDGGVIGMHMTLVIDQNGKIAVTGYNMTSNIEFNYQNITEDLWQG